jgi:hypothetical protein
VALFVF